jgi:hypothetical protein
MTTSTLPETLALLADGAPRAQLDLDRQWIGQLEEYAHLRELVRGSPLESVAATLAPCSLRLAETTIQVSLTLAASSERTPGP